MSPVVHLKLCGNTRCWREAKWKQCQSSARRPCERASSECIQGLEALCFSGCLFYTLVLSQEFTLIMTNFQANVWHNNENEHWKFKTFDVQNVKVQPYFDVIIFCKSTFLAVIQHHFYEKTRRLDCSDLPFWILSFFGETSISLWNPSQAHWFCWY